MLLLPFQPPSGLDQVHGFGKRAPASLVPQGGDNRAWYLAGRVLPMGYLNSVRIAQHIHRAVVHKAMGSVKGLGCSIQEMRRERSFSTFPNLFRVYLDNFHQLQMVDKKTASLIEGTPSEMVQHLREQYARSMLRRHPKKSVEQASNAEVQGAWLDGIQGTLCAKPAKVARYIALALEVGEGTCFPKRTSSSRRWFRLHRHVQKATAGQPEPDLAHDSGGRAGRSLETTVAQKRSDGGASALHGTMPSRLHGLPSSCGRWSRRVMLQARGVAFAILVG